MRKLLTASELSTLKRWGVPVRYVRGEQRRRIFERDHQECQVCESREDLTVAHRFPYREGILKFGFTPEWLNRDENLVVACRNRCNKLVEDLTVPQDEPKAEGQVRLGNVERSLLKGLAKEHRITVDNPDSAYPEAYFRDWEGFVAGGLPRKTVPILLRLEEKGYVFRRNEKKSLLSADFYLTQKARDDPRLDLKFPTREEREVEAEEKASEEGREWEEDDRFDLEDFM